MKHYTFDKHFDDVFTTARLLYELSQIKPIPDDIEQIKTDIKYNRFFEIEPKKSFFIPKSDGSYREITIPSTKSKIIQRVLATELADVIVFSDRSYAFRKGKSPYKAIMRIKDALYRYRYVAKADIKSFFDTIDHDILIYKLKKIIKDKKIIELIAYYQSKGMLRKGQWIDKNEGIYQGDVLSPLLSNIYLNDFDFYMQQKGFMHIRYSDDLLFFGKDKAQASLARKVASDYLAKLKLQFNMKKTYLSDIDKGFEYLGVRFVGNSISIDTQKLSQKLQKLTNETKNMRLDYRLIEKLNEKTIGFKNYYAKLIDDESQMQMLQDKLDEIVVDKIVQAKIKNELHSKQAIRELIDNLQPYSVDIQHTKWINTLISKAYEQISLQKPLKSAKTIIATEKRQYLQQHIKSTELIISEVGAYLGFSQGKIKVKIKGKVVSQVPINRITRIVLLNKHSSISTYLIYECAKHKIDIDFIDSLSPYAILTYHQHVIPNIHLAQLKSYFSPKGLEIVKEIVLSKSKNQINLIKYLNRRRDDNRLSKQIEIMQRLYSKIKNANDKKSLMGIEGNISVHYWNAFGLVLDIDGFVRTHQNSKDEINQALNYGYAIIYNRVQSALLHEGLNLYYPLYHSMQSKKPTLVFDMVEEFRQPIVDREILSILNRGQKITQTNGKLSKQSIKLIVQNIQERLATPTPSRYGKTPLYNIIKLQSNLLKRSILDKTKYKGFVNKY
jgi:group II intron reverse transcriptase/maturase/CRISPR-associated endonuclease Cas1